MQMGEGEGRKVVIRGINVGEVRGDWERYKSRKMGVVEGAEIGEDDERKNILKSMWGGERGRVL